MPHRNIALCLDQYFPETVHGKWTVGHGTLYMFGVTNCRCVEDVSTTIRPDTEVWLQEIEEKGFSCFNDSLEDPDNQVEKKDEKAVMSTTNNDASWTFRNKFVMLI